MPDPNPLLPLGDPLVSRGLAAGAQPGGGYGRYGRMFDFSRDVTPKIPNKCLEDVAGAMMKHDLGKPIDEPETADENPTIPAGYTYFGQFIDHDLTFDPTPLNAKDVDVAALEDFRSPAFDLDSVYGHGPDDQPFIYRKDGLHLRLGPEIPPADAHIRTRRDVLRLTPEEGGNEHVAIIGDKRNDENRIIAQLHSVFIAFHNKVVEDRELIEAYGGTWADNTSRFRTAARIVRWHYQWLVVNDYLERILKSETLAEVYNKGGEPKINHYTKPEARWPYIPVEFAGAAFRFGHSMVRPSYALNINVGPDREHRIPIFPRPDAADGAQDSLKGFGVPIPEGWGIDWRFFLDGLGKENLPGDFQIPQLSYRIDALLVDPLANLPEFRGAPTPLRSLAIRNLQRGTYTLGLPSGEQVAYALGIDPLKPEELWNAGAKDPGQAKLSDEQREEQQKELAETADKRRKVRDLWVDGGGSPLKRNTPLWYYVLREAEYLGTTKAPDEPGAAFGGQHLGPVGSRIVAETCIGLLWNDPSSFLRRHPRFEPHRRIAGEGKFTLGALVRYALSAAAA